MWPGDLGPRTLIHDLHGRDLSGWIKASAPGVCQSQSENKIKQTVARFYEPDLISDTNNPFVRDSNNKLVRRSYCVGHG